MLTDLAAIASFAPRFLAPCQFPTSPCYLAHFATISSRSSLPCSHLRLFAFTLILTRRKWTYDPATKAVQGFRLGPSDAQLGSSAAASDDDDEDVAVAMLKGRRTQLHSEEEEEVDQLDD